ncbi:MAG: hypothetical protein JNM28_07215 [Armatimonadetes bacterium]|nr:hypothetical protein [Armatimonadota bacterium]MBS1711798.1 hypothetical protein [Armatimonadota bacterium]MBX3109648.1 hypothetical protein [Fimbriimonadaceae bacterium]
MAGIAKLIKALITLAALATSIETLIRIARFAWSLVLKLGQIFRRGAVGSRFRPGFSF